MENIRTEHAALWNVATASHPFITTCADSSLNEAAFDKWLQQDYLFVQGFLQFTRGIATKASVPRDVEVFTGSVATIEEELKWFENRASSRGISLASIAPLETTTKYLAYLEEIGAADVSFALRAAAFYYIEAVYNAAWASVLQAQGPEGKYAVYASRWGSREFTEYTEVLRDIADSSRASLVVSDEEYASKVSKIAHTIFSLEVEFWDMAQGTDVAPELPNTTTTVVVGSTNPVKVDCVKLGLQQLVQRAEDNEQNTNGLNSLFSSPLVVIGVDVDSGVAKQPFSDKETRLGASNRARNAYSQYFKSTGDYPAYSVGIEGGISADEDASADLTCFAWVVVFDGKTCHSSRTATFALPIVLSRLVNEGVELGEADDRVFGRSNSKQGGGTVGYLTRNAISRTDYYVPAVTLAFMPLTWPSLYS